MTIGLTGGMGCGKSTVARLFQEEGFRLLDSDRIVREQLLVAPDVIELLRGRWGGDILDESGAVSRPRLAEIIFARDEERLWLEALLHPRVKAAWEAALAAEPEAEWVVEIPLLFEKGLEKGFDFTICVSASSPIQLARLEGRGIPQTLAEQRISKQLPLEQKQSLADFVVQNDGSMEFLRRQVGHLAKVLRSLPVRRV